jgi:hypothetical protein
MIPITQGIQVRAVILQILVDARGGYHKAHTVCSCVCNSGQYTARSASGISKHYAISIWKETFCMGDLFQRYKLQSAISCYKLVTVHSC